MSGTIGSNLKGYRKQLHDDAGKTVVIILDWTKLDSGLSSLDVMKEQVAFLLSEYRSLAMKKSKYHRDGNQGIRKTTTTSATIPKLEVVLLLESSGGSVAEYGQAGSLLLQLRGTPGIILTICVDRVAASGGYLLCCTASPGQLMAAPFALVGSIGVIGQLLNIHDLLKGWGIRPLVFRGGKDKAPVGLIGEVTSRGKRMTQTMINQTHRAFKNHVVSARPVLKPYISKIGNGHVWLGADALDLKLIDCIKTSDEYIGEKVEAGVRVLKMVRHQPSLFRLGPHFGKSGFDIRQAVSGIGQLVQNTLQTLSGPTRFAFKAS